MIQFFYEQSDKILQQTLTHIGLTFLALLVALVIGVPLGCWISHKPRVASLVIGFTGVLQTIPSIALLGILIPVLGIGVKPAIFALFLYALLPIVRNTYVGIREVDASVRDAALGLGMNQWQILTKVEIPLAMPVIFAGIRTATVINVGVATLAAYVAAGGLGEFIFGGIALNNSAMIMAGAIPAALLAVLFDSLLGWLQKRTDYKTHKSAKSGLKISGWILIGILCLSGLYIIPKTKQTRLLAGFAHEFAGRDDGYPGLINKYGLSISNLLLDQSLMYEAIFHENVDVISGYSTDGRIKAYHLRVLEDDKQAFPPYQAAWVVRRQTLVKYPQLQAVLGVFSHSINDSVMTALNYEVDYLHKLPAEVAKQFIQQQKEFHLEKSTGPEGTISIGSKVFSEQYILAELLKQLIEGYTNLQVVTKTGLGGTKICFDALNAGAIDLYPEYTGTGLLVILQPESQKLDSLKGDPDKVYTYVAQEFNKRYELEWQKPIGFNNAYALMMREAESKKLHIRTISELQRYLVSER
ncbi:ABC transporter permease/substrate-binding protein [Xanthocytophaga flava]|uniref:ABC transporter permease/substrate-binding protein n=1 Tax=Xanthocytophaga flava TaxID=3048013 RepID=UPI0028D2EE9C|nr:ABC transporter permease/substrate-binding protein [Xanthocytophaga flavus]MDJ1468618.1 ABC transporter permease/substrate-binding protein [Xanthocytophaga flavus]